MDMNNPSRTKIIATLGPAIATEEKIREMILAGIDVFRLNFSHGTNEEHEAMIHLVRRIIKESNASIALLGDLQGPKIRIGMMEEEGIIINEDDEIIFTTRECKGNRTRLPISYPDLPKDVNKGDRILIDDGKLRLEVISTDSKTEILARTINGGSLNSRKGVNLPDTKISIPSITAKDIQDVQFMLDHDIEWIALSFVRWANDIQSLKKIIRQRDKQTLVIAKIEKPEALEEIDKIIEAADAIMIARGDLGVEVSFDRVPFIQKQIVRKCIEKSTPVIIATQMLESMIYNFRPTRAEANDVANAVFDCADTVMLSGETSVGKYPIDSVKSMQKIIDYAEGTEFVHEYRHVPDIKSGTYISDTVCYNACRMTDQSGAKAIIVYTSIPQTGFQLASNRPKAPVYIFTPDKQLIRQLSIVWGVRAFYTDVDLNKEEAFNYSIRTLKREQLVVHGDAIIFVSSIPLFDLQGVNTIKLGYV
jgi:pyruvate kinase